METSFWEAVAVDSCLSLKAPARQLDSRMKLELNTKAGLDGAGLSSDVELGLLSIRTTAEASGRSAGFSWMHSSPISMQLRTSLSGYYDSASDGSTTSPVEPALHLSQTCTYDPLMYM